MQGRVVNTINRLNTLRNRKVENPDITTRIQQYELAFKMQDSVPKLMDITNETQETLDLYGVTQADGSFAYNCLLARRMAEQGVRFIQLYHRGWDHHNDLVKFMGVCSGLCDQGTAALIKDLKQRDMLDSTLVVWGTEFGRTPLAQGKDGRDHHPAAYTIWMAGGGSRAGTTYGKTDELGWSIEENPLHINDFQATLLHLFGIDDKRLVHRFKGLDFRLTGVGESGRVVKDLIA